MHLLDWHILLHFRRHLLDKDRREVRMLQEILLEDGELHSEGGGRERKFRWKNISKWLTFLCGAGFLFVFRSSCFVISPKTQNKMKYSEI